MTLHNGNESHTLMLDGWLANIKKKQRPIYLTLAESIIDSVEGGGLRPGSRLPARRDLAYKLGLGVNTVKNAYVELERRGYAHARVGSGTYIHFPKADTDISSWHLGGRPPGLVDLSMCRACDLQKDDSLLRSELAQLSNDYDHTISITSRPIIGLMSHRKAGQLWLQSLGACAPLDRLIVTNGNSHALLIVLSALTEPGQVVLAEEMTNNALISLSSMLHFQLQGLPLDDEGIIPDAFERSCRTSSVKVLVTTPNLNNPTCTLMSETRRRDIAAIARKHGVAVVENDAFGPLLEDPLPPLTSFLPEQGYYMTTLSKSSVPCLRIGYLTIPESNAHRVISRLRTTSWMASTLLAEIATRWIDSGQLNELAMAHRKELRRRQAIVSRTLKGYQLKSFPTGILAWLALPEPWRARDFVSAARDRNIAVTPVDPFMVGHAPEPQAIRLSVSMASDRAALQKALLHLRDLLDRRPKRAAC